MGVRLLRAPLVSARCGAGGNGRGHTPGRGSVPEVRGQRLLPPDAVERESRGAVRCAGTTGRATPGNLSGKGTRSRMRDWRERVAVGFGGHTVGGGAGPVRRVVDVTVRPVLVPGRRRHRSAV